MTAQSKDNLSLAKSFPKENHTNEHRFVMDWLNTGSNGDFSRTILHQTTESDAANEAANRAAAFGFDHQVWSERQGLPTAGAAFLVSLNELLRDAHGRREYLVWLLAQKLPMPLIIVSRDFLLPAPTVVHHYLMLAPQLGDDLFRAVRDGHLYLPSDEGEQRKAA